MKFRKFSLLLASLMLVSSLAFNNGVVRASHHQAYHSNITRTTRYRSRVRYRLACRMANQISKHHCRVIYVSMAKHMHYYSQLHPTRIKSACEGASLLMALSIKGHSHHMTLRHFINQKIGWYNFGNKGVEAEYRYDRNPYLFSATIYPKGLKRVADKMGAKTKIIDHASKHQIIHLLMSKDPVVIEASHHLELFERTKPWKPSDHIICLIGYRRDNHGHEFVQYADPLYNSQKSGVRWGTWHQFWRSYDRTQITGRRAIVVLK